MPQLETRSFSVARTLPRRHFRAADRRSRRVGRIQGGLAGHSGGGAMRCSRQGQSGKGRRMMSTPKSGPLPKCRWVHVHSSFGRGQSVYGFCPWLEEAVEVGLYVGWGLTPRPVMFVDRAVDREMAGFGTDEACPDHSIIKCSISASHA